MMIQDYSVPEVLKTTECYTEAKENARNLVRYPSKHYRKALIFQVLSVLLFPSTICTEAGQLSWIGSHPYY